MWSGVCGEHAQEFLVMLTGPAAHLLEERTLGLLAHLAERFHVVDHLMCIVIMDAVSAMLLPPVTDRIRRWPSRDI